MLDDTREKREELKIKLQRHMEDDEHYSKLAVMKVRQKSAKQATKHFKSGVIKVVLRLKVVFR